MPDGLRYQEAYYDSLAALSRIWRALPPTPSRRKEVLALFAQELGPCLPGLHASFAVLDDEREHLVLQVSGHAGAPDPDLDGATLLRLSTEERKDLESGHPWGFSMPGPVVPETARRLEARGIDRILLLPLTGKAHLEAVWVLGVVGAHEEKIPPPVVLESTANALAATLARSISENDEAARHEGRLAKTGRLVANVAHELGSPLQSVISLAQLLQRDPGRGDRLEAASRILRSALRCRSLVQDLLDYARKQPTRKDRIRVEEAVMEALELDGFSSVGEVQVSVSESTPVPPVRGDLRRLTQVFVNLIHNARQAVAGQPGHGQVRVVLDVVDGPESRLALAPAQSAVRIACEDQGPGVPTALRDKIFEPFVGTKPEGEGTGLGLSICRDILADLDGVLYLDSAHAPGARFVVELPAADEADPAPDEVEDAPSGGPYRILLIDDDQDVLQTYEVILAHEDHHVRSCTRAKEALDLLADDPFDVIICDVRLPDLMGPEFLEHLRERDPAMARRVIFASGDIVNDDSRSFLSNVSNHVLVKPFLLDDLLQAIEKVAESGGTEEP